MIPAGLLAIVAGLVLVRLGWSGRRAVAAAGWALATLGLALLADAAGAWGIAVGVLAGTASALAAVLVAGWRSPVHRRRPPRRAPSITIPVTAPDLARRMAVFVLVVPGAFVAAQWLALAVDHFARGHGAGAADATVLGWMVQPLAWGLVMTVQMTRAGPARMIAAPAAAGLLGAALWGAA